jgi:mRNA interferase MazF
VLSPKSYNARTGLALLCPVTSKVKGYTTEVAVKNVILQGVILIDAIKSLDWKNRGVTFIARASAETVAKVSEKISALINGKD